MSQYGSCPTPFITYTPYLSPSSPYRPSSAQQFPFLPFSSLSGLEVLICARLASDYCGASREGVRRCRDARRDGAGFDGREGVRRWNLAMGLGVGGGEDGSDGSDATTTATRTRTQTETEDASTALLTSTYPSPSAFSSIDPSTTETQTQTEFQTQTDYTLTTTTLSSPTGPNPTADITSDGSPFGISSAAVRGVSIPRRRRILGLVIAALAVGGIWEMVVVV